MPKVGKGNKAVHYPYSKKGMKDAMAHSKRTGEPMSIEYGYGGPVKKYPGGGMVKPMKPMYGHGGMVRPMRPMYKHGGMVLSPEQKIALAKMMYGGNVPKKSKKKKK